MSSFGSLSDLSTKEKQPKSKYTAMQISFMYFFKNNITCLFKCQNEIFLVCAIKIILFFHRDMECRRR
jgi:hypothetical protein